MKVAILNWRDAAHPNAGGAEVFVHEVGHRWASVGHDVTLYSSRARGLAKMDEDEGLSIVRVGDLRRGTHHLFAPATARRDGAHVILESINTFPYQLPLRGRRLPPSLPLVHQMAVDVWDAHLPRSLAAAARRAEPLLFRPYRRRRVAAVSESSAADLHAAGVRETVVVPQGGIGPQATFGKEPAPTLLFVGRLAANKRPDHAVEAFRRVTDVFPEARLWIIGDGPMKEDLSRRLPSGAQMLGRLNRSELLKRMSKAHLLLVTSVREGWGLVVTEANAMGTPAVAYDVPGLRDSVRNGTTGLLTTPQPARIASAAIRLLESPKLYTEMVRNAREWGGGCTWDTTARFLMTLVEKLANEVEGHVATAPSSPPS